MNVGQTYNDRYFWPNIVSVFGFIYSSPSSGLVVFYSKTGIVCSGRYKVGASDVSIKVAATCSGQRNGLIVLHLSKPGVADEGSIEIYQYASGVFLTSKSPNFLHIH